MEYDFKKAVLTAFDTLDPVYNKIQKENEKYRAFPHRFPRYHVVDHPLRVIDLYEEYPNQKYQLVYDRGYVYVGNEYGQKLFMSMHCQSHKLEDAEEFVEWLKEKRNRPFPF